ncbi:hypothetical protein BH18ACT16_BH18ACT16_06500 [soil metagenome]
MLGLEKSFASLAALEHGSRVAIDLANSYFRRRAAETRAKRRLQDQQRTRRGPGLDSAAAITIRPTGS